MAEETPTENPTHAGIAVKAQDTGRLLMLQRKLDPEDPPEVQGTWEFPSGGRECRLCRAAFTVEGPAAQQASAMTSVDDGSLGGVRMTRRAGIFSAIDGGRRKPEQKVLLEGDSLQVIEAQAGTMKASSSALEGVAGMMNDEISHVAVDSDIEPAVKISDLSFEVRPSVSSGASCSGVKKALAVSSDAVADALGEKVERLSRGHAASVPPGLTQEHQHEWETPEQAAWREFQEETGLPVPEGETVNGWRSPNGIYQGFVYLVPVEAEAFDDLNPAADAAETVDPDNPEREHPDVTAWFTLEQIKDLGTALRPEVAAMDWSVFDPQEDEMAEEQKMPRKWFGVLAPEGAPSGDKRMFKEGALRMRSLPLPLTWQKVSAPGHDGNVVTAIIQEVWRDAGLIWGAGEYLDSPEADEHYELVDRFGRYGVSIDADDLDEFSIEMDDQGTTVFTDARVCSACAVSIPAFAEAWMMNGEYADFAADFAGGWGAPSMAIPSPGDESDTSDTSDEEGDCSCNEEDENYDPECECEDSEDVEDAPMFALLNEIDFRAATPIQFADVAPGITEDGPGWLTHPVDTDRLRDYWVRGEGAAKIGWGAPGDWSRCRANLAKYVKPRFLAGYCANRHFDALGYWPGQTPHGGETMPFQNNVEVGEEVTATSLTAAAPKANLPKAWFEDPKLDKATALTVTEDGRVFGHLARWGQCHIGFDGECIVLPKSHSNYSYFRIGVVDTDGGQVYTGALTLGGGHAAGRLGWRAAVEHYDSTSSVIADIAVGEDEFGVWMAGAIREGVTESQIRELKAAGKASGDWREVVRGSGTLELVAALAVNVGGFPVPRTEASMADGHVVSLVAAGVVADEGESVFEELTDIIMDRINSRTEAARRQADLRKKVYAGRIEALKSSLTETGGQ